MSEKFYISLATSLSLLLLAVAFGFQYLGGFEPCELCIWQRWPHAIAVFVGALAIASSARWLAFAGAALLTAGAGIAFYHVGVEQGIFLGLESCSSSPLEEMTGKELLDFSASENLPQDCSQAAWSMFGLSMAAWNGIFCLVAAALWSKGAVAARLV
ncbi:MAG: disulfide bond formation protein B [Albidovulum sp.]|nr:disulfide bond formation protein B [Albidovulum sp.]MDE0531067.1 disulfide bond formation protein B [Albidovulum sp.]